MAHFTGVMGSLLLCLSLSHLVLCHPIHPSTSAAGSPCSSTDAGSLSVHCVGATRSIALRGTEGGDDGRPSAVAMQNYTSSIWSEKNKLAIGLGIGLGAIFGKFIH